MENVEVIALPCLNHRFYLPKFSYAGIRELVERSDIVHLMGHWTFLNALVYQVVRSLRKAYAVCPAGALPVFGRSKMIKMMYNQLVGKRIIRNADCHIAITRGELPAFLSYGVDSDRVSVIPNGINPDDFLVRDDAEFREKFGLNEKLIILYMGRLNRIKGPDLLLRAFCNLKDELPESQLVFAGPDEGMVAELKKFAFLSDMEDRVNFIGHIGGADKSLAYHAADLLVVPSRQEAMSIVALESGAAGTPVLITDQCGFDEIAAVEGGMVVKASVEGLQEGLLAMTVNPAKLKIMGQNLEKFTREHFLWDHMVNRYLELFSRIMR
jgi:glycosyltransferase involved in cell wall biosynthesis